MSGGTNLPTDKGWTWAHQELYDPEFTGYPAEVARRGECHNCSDTWEPGSPFETTCTARPNAGLLAGDEKQNGAILGEPIEGSCPCSCHDGAPG